MAFRMTRQEWRIVWIFALIKLGLHLLTANNYELHRDAMLYHALGQTLDWGYLSVPPLIAVSARFFTGIIGHSTFALRLFPALLGMLSVFIMGLIVKEFNGKARAMIIAMGAFLMSPAYLRTHSLFQPVALNQFFWLFIAWLVIIMIRTDNDKLWIAVFAVFGLAFLNKYAIVFWGMGLMAALLLTPQRRLLRSIYFFTGCLLCLLIISPNLLWQNSHGWPVCHHMAELKETQLVHVNMVDFMLAQLTMNLPGLFIWLAGLFGLLFYSAWCNQRMLGLWCLFTLLILMLLHGKPYYTLGLYPVLLAVGGVLLERSFRKKWIFAGTAGIFLMGLPVFPLSLPVLPPAAMARVSTPMASLLNRWEDGEIHALPQDFADMTGWRALGEDVAAFYHQLPEEKQKNCLIFSENYGIASSLLWYGGDDLPAPMSFSDQFLFWAPDTIDPGCVIYLTHCSIDEVESFLGPCVLAGQVDNDLFRENGLNMFYADHPSGELSAYYAQEVRKRKKPFKL